MNIDVMQKYADDLEKIVVFPQGKVFRLTYDPIVNSLRIISRNHDYLEELRQAFSIENPSAFFTKQYGFSADPRLYLINKFGYFGSGLVHEILKWISTQYGTLDFVAISSQCAAYIKDIITPLKETMRVAFNGEEFEIANVAEDTGRNAELRRLRAEQLANNVPENKVAHPFEFRGYQEDAIKALLFNGYGRGLIEVPTAGGKSFILANFIWNILKNIDRQCITLILVPNVQLVKQFYKDLIDYGFEKRMLAMFCGSMTKLEKAENDINTAKVIIANRQYVFKNEALLPKYKLLICDEVHGCLASSTAEFIARCPASLKIGCSGTLPADMYNKNQLIGMFGRVLFKEEVTNLQDSGFISKLKITTLSIVDKAVEKNRNLLFHTNSLIKYKADDFDSTVKFNDAVNAEHEYFAKWFKELYKPVLDYAAKLNGNTLILFDKIDIGTSIYEYFKEIHPERSAYYNDGSTDVDIREDMRETLEKSSDNVLFANVQILSTGTNIKRLHHLVFCFSSKSTVRVIQSIGRILRLYDGKEYAHLVDCCFNTKYSQRHYAERLKLYKQFYKKSKPDEVLSMNI